MPSPRAQREAHVHALAARQHALVTRGQAMAAGLSADAVAHRVQTGLWIVAAPGVYRLAGAPRSWPQRALAAVLSAGPGAVASHRTAAHLWGLDGFAAPGRIDVTLGGRHGRRRRPGVVIHHTVAADLDPRTRALVPVTGPARTLLDVCAVGDDLEALTALDEIRRLRLATWDELWATRVLHCGRGRPGAARYRRTLATRGDHRVPDTMFARLFLRLLARAGLPEPAAELPVVAGGRRYRLDLAFVPERVAVELDGRGHLTERAFEADRARDARLAAAGWRVLRITWRRFQDQPAEIAGEIRAALDSRPV